MTKNWLMVGVGLGLGVTLIRWCIAPYSKDCSLASNLRAQQQGLELRWSYSSEKSSPRLQILNRNESVQYDGDAVAIASLKKASPSTVFRVCTVLRCLSEIWKYLKYSITKGPGDWGVIYNIDSAVCTALLLKPMNSFLLRWESTTPKHGPVLHRFLHSQKHTQVCSLHQLLHWLSISSSYNTLLDFASEITNSAPVLLLLQHNTLFCPALESTSSSPALLLRIYFHNSKYSIKVGRVLTLNATGTWEWIYNIDPALCCWSQWTVLSPKHLNLLLARTNIHHVFPCSQKLIRADNNENLSR